MKKYTNSAPPLDQSQLCIIMLQSIEKLKEKLNIISDEGCWDVDDIFQEHSYSDSTVFDCVIYYLAGYVFI